MTNITDSEHTFRLQTMRQLADTINDLSNDVNERLEEFEDAVSTIGPGVVSADIAVQVSQARESNTWRIGYGKCEDRWCFTAYRSASHPGVGPSRDATPQQPLLNAPRLVRIAALAQIGEVLDAIISKQREMLVTLRAGKTDE